MYDESMNDDFTESEVVNNNSQQGEQRQYGSYRNPSWQNNGQENRGNYQRNGNGFQGNSGNFQRNGGGYNKGGFNRGNYGGNQGGGNFKPKEFNGVAKVYAAYAIASNKGIPSNVIEEFKSIVPELDKSGFIMRVSALDETIDNHVRDMTENKELYLPWRGFNNIEQGNTYTSPETKAIAKLFQPGYDGLSNAIQMIVAKNVRLALGNDNKSPANFILVWSEDGAETLATKTSATGNVGHLIAVASAAHIPVYNLGKPGCLERLKRNLNIGSVVNV